MHRHGLAQRARGEAELARLRVAPLLALALALHPLEVRVAPRLHQLLLARVVLLGALLVALQLLLEDLVLGLVVLVVRVDPRRVLRQVLALHLDGEREHVALLRLLLVLHARVVRDLDVGEHVEEQVDVAVLLVVVAAVVGDVWESLPGAPRSARYLGLWRIL